jgi:hypothetical protein
VGKFTLRDLLEVILIPLMCAAVYILWDMNKSIANLNTQVAVVIAENIPLKSSVSDHEERIRALELKAKP